MADRLGIHRRKAAEVTALTPDSLHNNRLTAALESLYPSEDTREVRRQAIREKNRALERESVRVSRSLVSLIAARQRAEASGDKRAVRECEVNLETLRRYYDNQLKPMLARVSALVTSLDKTKGLKATVEAMALAETELQMAAEEFDPDEIEDISEDLRTHTDEIDLHIKSVKTFATADMSKAREKVEAVESEALSSQMPLPALANRHRIPVDYDAQSRRVSLHSNAKVDSGRLKRRDTPMPKRNHRGGKGEGGAGGGELMEASPRSLQVVAEEGMIQNEEDGELEGESISGDAEEEEAALAQRTRRKQRPSSPVDDCYDAPAENTPSPSSAAAQVAPEGEEYETPDALIEELLSLELDPPRTQPKEVYSPEWPKAAKRTQAKA